MGFRSGDFRFSYENDGGGFGGILGDGQDRWRSAALSVGIGEYSLNVKIFTGERRYGGEEDGRITGSDSPVFKNGIKYPRGLVNEVGTPHRLSALSVGYRGFNIGINSERYVAYPIQARFAHGINPLGAFRVIDPSTYSYYQYKTLNRFTSW